MNSMKFDDQFANLIRLAVDLCKIVEADALLVMVEGPTDWKQLKKSAAKQKVVLAADSEEELAGAKDAGIDTVIVNLPEAPVNEKLTQALLESVADDILAPGAEVVAVFSAFDPGKIDSISYLRLDERLGRLTARDLRKLETQVPLETLKLVVDLAVEIGRDGREGKTVGTLIVVGDHRSVLEHSQPMGFDPVKGYKRNERNLHDPHVREAIKEVSLLDGAFVVSADGTVVAACQALEAGGTDFTISKGLGTRHRAAAAISKKTKSIAVAVSESNGTVRLFQNGQVVLRIEPFRRAMTVKELDPESPVDS